MARVRCITEMGMGVDVHGRDATKAARRAVSDAIRHSSLGFFRMLGKTANDMFVDVTIAVPNPEAVDTAIVAKELPYGTVQVKAVAGGLEIPSDIGNDPILIANAAVIVSFGASAVPGLASLPNGDTKIAFRVSNVSAGLMVVRPSQSVWDACTVNTPVPRVGLAVQLPPVGVIEAE